MVRESGKYGRRCVVVIDKLDPMTKTRCTTNLGQQLYVGVELVEQSLRRVARLGKLIEFEHKTVDATEIFADVLFQAGHEREPTLEKLVIGCIKYSRITEI